MLVWETVKRCSRQVRVSFGGIAGIDYPAFIGMGERLGADIELLMDVLPGVEAVILFANAKDEDE